VITHPDKVLFPADGVTKGELARYYEQIAPLMLPHISYRPLTMERYPAGIEKKGFIQKDVSRGYPAWLERVEVEKREGTVWHPLLNDTRALLWAANQNCITPHVGSSRVPRLEQPDLCVFDLDPSVEDSAALRRAALAVRDTLAELGLRAWIKTSGSKGFHIAVPMDSETRFEPLAHFAHGVGALLVKRDPTHLTQEFLKSDRQGRILIDTGRNAWSATYAAPYSVRARPGAPVSAPCTWEELESGKVGPESFKLAEMAARVALVGDLWSDLHREPASLARAVHALSRFIQPEEWQLGAGRIRRKGKPRRPSPGQKT
jgi:bifunctional non-homologous end joining protein LigD